MKKAIYFLAVFGFAAFVHAQSPQLINYQAMAVDPQGRIMAYQSLEVRLTILENDFNGSSVYSETHIVTTGQTGIFSLKIGAGRDSIGNISQLQWGDHPYFLKVEIDFQGDGSFTEMGTSQLVSVPYAFHAQTVTYNDDADADPVNELQTLSIEGSRLSISNGNSINLPNSGNMGSGDDDPNNEIQDLSVNQNGSVVELGINKGGLGVTFGVQDGDSDPTNEWQTLSKMGNMVSLNPEGGSFIDEVDDADSDPTNEIQSLTLNGDQLNISGSNQVDLSSFQSPWKPGLVGIQYDGHSAAIEDPVLTNKSYMTALGFHVEKGDYRSYYRADEWILEPIRDKDNIGLSGNQHGINIYQAGNPPVFLSKWNRDGLTFSGGNQGMFMKDYVSFKQTDNIGSSLESLFNPREIRFKDGDWSSFIDALGGCFGSPLSDLCIGNLGISISEGLTPDQKTTRWSFNPDSLVMYNRNTFKTTYLGKDPFTLGGSLSLFDGSVSSQIIHLGENPNRFGTGHLVLSGNGKAGLEAFMEPLGSADRLATVLKINGPNSVNVVASNTSASADLGRLDVYDDQSSARVGMFIDFDGTGRIYSDVKHFRMDHPHDPKQEIWYASLEGPEAAAYVRGTTLLDNGEAFVPFPDHFIQVASPDDMTVILTPLEWDTYGLAVVRKTQDGFLVKELKGGIGNFSFDWEVKCTRRGFENYQVVVEKESILHPTRH